MTNFSKYSFVGLACGVFLAEYAVFAFTPPTEVPPGGNTLAPVNIGSDPQVKAGGLWVGSLGVDGSIEVNGDVQVEGRLRLGSFASLPACGSAGAGEIIFNTTEGKPYICDGTGWTILGAEVSADADGDGVSRPADCNDEDENVWQVLSCYVDADVDEFTVGSAVNVCRGSSCTSPSGYREAPSATDDCLDSGGGDSFVFRNVGNLIIDKDNDGFATAVAAATYCVGVSTGIDGRTYYKSTNNTFDYLPQSQANVTIDPDDAVFTDKPPPKTCPGPGANQYVVHGTHTNYAYTDEWGYYSGHSGSGVSKGCKQYCGSSNASPSCSSRSTFSHSGPSTTFHFGGACSDSAHAGSHHGNKCSWRPGGVHCGEWGCNAAQTISCSCS